MRALLRNGLFEAAVVESQAMEGRSGLHALEFVCSPHRRTKRRSGTIAQTM
jgi:hypothetical protein